jgi:hypothetical protein
VASSTSVPIPGNDHPHGLGTHVSGSRRQRRHTHGTGPTSSRDLGLRLIRLRRSSWSASRPVTHQLRLPKYDPRPVRKMKIPTATTLTLKSRTHCVICTSHSPVEEPYGIEIH